MAVNPCLRCGACCAHFRASFYWAEASDAKPDGVPLELTEDLTEMYRVMKGTNCATPRCIALQGEIGGPVRCTIHPQRASACRNFDPSYLNGVHNERCDQARIAHHLPPLTPADWIEETPDEPEPLGPTSPDTTLQPAA